MPQHQDQHDASLTALKERMRELGAKIEADKARLDAEIAREQEKRDRWERWHPRLHEFPHARSLRIPGWLAALVIALFVGVLIWAALQSPRA